MNLKRLEKNSKIEFWAQISMGSKARKRRILIEIRIFSKKLDFCSEMTENWWESHERLRIWYPDTLNLHWWPFPKLIFRFSSRAEVIIIQDWSCISVKMATVLYQKISQMFKMEIPLCKYHHLFFKYFTFTWNMSYWNIYHMFYWKNDEHLTNRPFWPSWFFNRLVIFGRFGHF